MFFKTERYYKFLRLCRYKARNGLHSAVRFLLQIWRVRLIVQINIGNGDALRIIAQMALAIINNSTLEELTDEERDIIAHFKNPAMPSVAVTADAAIKIASVRSEFGSTDIFLEMVGFDQADIRRINAQELLADFKIR